MIPIARAATCEPTISWAIDSQFFVGETGKLIATIKNACDTTFNIKTEVNTEKTLGYIKVYSVASEDQKPMPKSHSVNVGSTTVYVELGKKDTDEDTKKVVYFIQPDEMIPITSSGTYYTLYENFYVDDVLKQSKEIQINVKKPLQVTYKLPTSIRLGTPFSSSITINNLGAEILSSLKVCFSSPDNVVSFSEPCKTWTNIPSKYTDTFNFIVTGLMPGSYQNQINAKIDYITYTGLTISESYNHPSLMITTTQAGTPSLSYSFIRGTGNLTLQITNKGNGTAFNCLATINSPADCVLNSSYLKSFTKSGEGNVYEIECGDEISLKESSIIILTFNPAEITSSCLIKGMISYKDGTGKSFETTINNFYLKPTTTTIPATTRKGGINFLYIIIILIIIVIVIALLVFLKYRKPEIYAKVIQPFQKIFEKIKVIFKLKIDKKE